MKYLFLAAVIFFTLTVNAQDRHLDTITKDGVKFTYVEKMPEAGYDFNKYLSENIHYPDSARAYNIEGRVLVQFLVTETGIIDSVHIMKGISKECDEEALRVVKNMPPWKPGMRAGLPVEVWFTLPISFKLTEPEQIYTYVEYMPVPQGGYNNANEYIDNHIQYPKTARRKKIQGRVLVKFVVNEDGSISNCKVVRGIGGGCDEEAVRVLNSMPPWKSGKHDGKPVKVYFVMPVVFKL